MARASIEEDRLKEILKSALVEVLEERRDLVSGLVEEAVEDLLLVHAIQEGEDTPDVSREEIFRILEPRD